MAASCNECGIGFKYICDLMLERDILIGGEESGGIGITRHLPERDGILNSLLLANIMAEEGKPLGQLVRDLQQEYGEHHYGRIDLHLSNEVKEDAMRRASEKPDTIGSFNVQKVETLDGVKFFLDAPTNGNGAEAWVLVRASGTEPLLAHLLRSSISGTGVADSEGDGRVRAGRQPLSGANRGDSSSPQSSSHPYLLGTIASASKPKLGCAFQPARIKRR